MMSDTIKVEDASRDQLSAFAASHLGIQLPHNVSREKALAAVRAAHDGATIDVAPPSQTADSARTVIDINNGRPTAPAPKPALAEPMVKIIVARDGKEDGDRPIYLANNGTYMMVPRGEACSIPWKYFCVLRDARQTTSDQDPKTLDMREITVDLHPYQVLEMPSRDEIAAWDERTRDRLVA